METYLKISLWVFGVSYIVTAYMDVIAILRLQDKVRRLDEKLAEHFEKVHGDVYEKKGEPS